MWSSFTTKLMANVDTSLKVANLLGYLKLGTNRTYFHTKRVALKKNALMVSPMPISGAVLEDSGNQ